MKVTFKTFLVGAVALSAALFAGNKIAKAAGGGNSDYEVKHVHWHFDGWRGTFDRSAMQRGYQVYKEACSSCHQLKFMSFRHLGDKGGPYYIEKYAPIDNPWVKALAADWIISDVDIETGEAITRDGKPADKFPAAYANDYAAAAANFAKAPPDLSVMAKARPNGPDHIYNFLISFDEEDDRYNKFLGSQVAMPNQLYDGRVEYEGYKSVDKDGNEVIMEAPEPTVDQMARDVTEFLVWASDPKMEERKSLGISVMIYLLLLAGLLYFSYREVWRNVKH